LKAGRLAMLASAGLLLGFCAGIQPTHATERYVRDWQVERPLSAGVLKGLTLGVFPRTRYGEGARPASAHDPYGMSLAVYREVARLGCSQYRVGLVSGIVFWMFCAGGGLFRRLTTLKARRLEMGNAR
jgi:hypothetical protein